MFGTEPDRRRETALTWLITLVLGLAAFPSWTALTPTGAGHFAGLVGPLNPLKIFGWASALAVAIQYPRFKRQGLTTPAIVFIGGLILFSIVPAARCLDRSVFLRESAVMILGLLGALSFFTLSVRQRACILTSMFLAYQGTSLVGLISPDARDWMFVHWFDPETPREAGQRLPMIGVFGVQSMGKLWAFSPWIYLAWFYSTQTLRPRWRQAGIAVSAALILISIPATLATTQRGPMIGVFAGILAWAIHPEVRRQNQRALLWATGSILAGLAAILLVLPNDMVRSRLYSLVGGESRNALGEHAANTRSFRYLITRHSWLIIRDAPMGNACPAADYHWAVFDGTPFSTPAHSHSLVLQQFRSRGWIWGFVHLGLWILAFWRSWRAKTAQAAAVWGAVTVVFVSGFFDHPWWVINQAMLMGLILVWAWQKPTSEPARVQEI